MQSSRQSYRPSLSPVAERDTPPIDDGSSTTTSRASRTTHRQQVRHQLNQPTASDVTSPTFQSQFEEVDETTLPHLDSATLAYVTRAANAAGVPVNTYLRMAADTTSTRPANVNDPTRATNVPVTRLESSVLFPTDTRAQGLDHTLVQDALSKTLTAADLHRHIGDSTTRGPGPIVPRPASSTASSDSDKTVVPVRHYPHMQPPVGIGVAQQPVTRHRRQPAIGERESPFTPHRSGLSQQPVTSPHGDRTPTNVGQSSLPPPGHGLPQRPPPTNIVQSPITPRSLELPQRPVMTPQRAQTAVNIGSPFTPRPSGSPHPQQITPHNAPALYTPPQFRLYQQPASTPRRPQAPTSAGKFPFSPPSASHAATGTPQGMMNTQQPYQPFSPVGPEALASGHGHIPSPNHPYAASGFTPRGRRGVGRGTPGPSRKRSDQGPLPSAADIYPDDAVFSPQSNPAMNAPEGRRRSVLRSGPNRFQRRDSGAGNLSENLQVEDAAAWPTPAEAISGATPTGDASPHVPPMCPAPAQSGSAQHAQERQHPAPAAPVQRTQQLDARAQAFQIPTASEYPASAYSASAYPGPAYSTSAYPGQAYSTSAYPAPAYFAPEYAALAQHAPTQPSQTPLTSAQIAYAEAAAILPARPQPTQTESAPTQGFHPYWGAPAPAPSDTVEEQRTDDYSIADFDLSEIVDEGRNELLNPQQRPLSPRQTDGSRYGMRYYGIAIGDHWDPNPVQQGTPFRVRPMNHHGWGGQHWAARGGRRGQ